MKINDIKIEYTYVGKIPDTNITSVKKAVSYMQGAFSKKALQEQLYVILLDSKLRPIGRHLIIIGTINSCIFSPADIFRSAILAGASSFIAVHNHPSGCAKPSEEDLQASEKLHRAGELMQIPMRDFIIIGEHSGQTHHWSHIEQNGGFL